ncbi:hypothetical protein AX17_006097 [Amanita inopinata Kibby_2008]|nr:hypothetical protein AX17_006097 [Amanita inopinata Kibby_2008]
MNTSTPSKRSSVSSSESPSSQPPMTPPALEPARIYSPHSPPPNTPPPLAHATLPATLHLTDPASSRSSSSPETSYSPINHHLMPMASHSMPMPGSQSQSYRSGTSTYQEQSQGAGFTYVHTTPLHSASHSAGSFSSYSNAHGSFNNHSLSHLSSTSPIIHSSRHNTDTSISGIASRHSISHISHPQSYSQTQPPSGGPPSPASSHSVSSHTSGPPTPTYPVFHDDGHSYHGNGLMSGNEQNGNAHMGLTSHLLHPANAYHHATPQATQSSSAAAAAAAMGIHNGRFVDSPPPTLAPIQDERLIRREERHSTQSHSASPYIHHPQPLATDYPYHQSLSLGHAAWKSDNGLRKGVGALVQ